MFVLPHSTILQVKCTFKQMHHLSESIENWVAFCKQQMQSHFASHAEMKLPDKMGLHFASLIVNQPQQNFERFFIISKCQQKLS